MELAKQSLKGYFLCVWSWYITGSEGKEIGKGRWIQSGGRVEENRNKPAPACHLSLLPRCHLQWCDWPRRETGASHHEAETHLGQGSEKLPDDPAGAGGAVGSAAASWWQGDPAVKWQCMRAAPGVPTPTFWVTKQKIASGYCFTVPCRCCIKCL